MSQKDIKFNKQIYNRSSIVCAMKAFKKVASFKLSGNRSYYIVKISKVSSDAKNLVRDEFCNYVISAM
jgi:hypothetical protein